MESDEDDDLTREEINGRKAKATPMRRNKTRIKFIILV
jgi:hypothetical protein